MPRTMNNQGNKRTTKEGFSDLRFQNFSLLKNRSWLRLSSTKGRCRVVLEPLPDHRRNLAAAMDEGKCHSDDDDYEDPELQLPKAWPSMKILPARPIQESEYADTRYFKDMMEAPLLLPPKASVPTGKQSWNAGMRRQEEVFHRDKAISKDVRSQHFKGLKCTEENKTPVPPPRPTITLPKKYQPLPPAPPEISAHFSPRHGFPEVQRGLRQISSKDVCEVLGAEEGSYHQEKPGPSHPSQNQTTEKSPPAITSSSYVPAKHSVHVRGHPDTTQRCLPQRRQTAARHGPHNQVLPYENTNPGKPVPAKPDEKIYRSHFNFS